MVLNKKLENFIDFVKLKIFFHLRGGGLLGGLALLGSLAGLTGLADLFPKTRKFEKFSFKSL